MRSLDENGWHMLDTRTVDPRWVKLLGRLGGGTLLEKLCHWGRAVSI